MIYIVFNNTEYATIIPSAIRGEQLVNSQLDARQQLHQFTCKFLNRESVKAHTFGSVQGDYQKEEIITGVSRLRLV